MYLIHNQTVRGMRHIRENTPCEDASAAVKRGGAVILVCADGHSDKRCTRAAKGAALAVQTAVEKLSVFAEEADSHELFNDTEQVVRHLIRSLIYGWHEAVQSDLAANPFTDGELDPVSCGAEYRAGIGVQRAYGTTLIAAVITRKYILLLHQGDGLCLLYRESGEAFSPVSKDPACVGNIATSLCSENADSETRYTLIENTGSNIVAAALATDGIQSGSARETSAYIASVFSKEHMADILSERSHKTGGDDVSLAYAVVDERACESLRVAAAAQLERVRLEYAVQSCRDKVYSIEHGGKLDALRPASHPEPDVSSVIREAAARRSGETPPSVRKAKRLFVQILRDALRLYKERMAQARIDLERNAEYEAVKARYEEAKQALCKAEQELENYSG